MSFSDIITVDKVVEIAHLFIEPGLTIVILSESNNSREDPVFCPIRICFFIFSDKADTLFALSTGVFPDRKIFFKIYKTT